MLLLRSRIGEAPDSTRALWHASRRRPTMEQMFLFLLLFWRRGSNTTPSLTFISLYMQDRDSRLWRCVRSYEMRCSPRKVFVRQTDFVKMRLDKKCDRFILLAAAMFPPLGRLTSIAYVLPPFRKQTLPETFQCVCI